MTQMHLKIAKCICHAVTQIDPNHREVFEKFSKSDQKADRSPYYYTYIVCSLSLSLCGRGSIHSIVRTEIGQIFQNDLVTREKGH